MKKKLNNFVRLLKIFIITVICISVQQAFVFAEPSTIPVTTSYDDMVKAINQPQTSVTNANVETPAHAAVTGSITSDEIEVINSQSSVNNSEIQKSVDNYVKAKPQKSFRKSILSLFLKFLISMLWVGISSIAIFIILLSYKKFVSGRKRVTPTYESKAHSLDTPTNFKEAIKLFLDKTKWS